MFLGKAENPYVERVSEICSVMGQTRPSCLGQKSLSSAVLVKHAKISGQMPVCPNLKIRENAYFPAFSPCPQKKTPAELLPSRSLFYAVKDSPLCPKQDGGACLATSSSFPLAPVKCVLNSFVYEI